MESAIGFAQWIVDDPNARAAGLEQAKRDMALVAAIGGTRIAAPPTGATSGKKLDLRLIADRYRTLCAVGREIGVAPQLEVWGFSANLSRLSESTYVCIEAAHPNACLLPDVFHLYKGGNDFTSLKMLGGAAMHCFHLNDYPADPPREQIGDAQRVFPGDGVAPLSEILATLSAAGFRGALSLELFNRDYWQDDVRTVAETGLRKMRDAVDEALDA